MLRHRKHPEPDDLVVLELSDAARQRMRVDPRLWPTVEVQMHMSVDHRIHRAKL